MGTLTYQAIYQGDTLTRTFKVATAFAPKDLTTYTVNDIDFNLSPNPATTDLFIQHEDWNSTMHFNIFDSNGKLCKQGLLNNDENNIAIEKLATGIYCLQLADANGTLSAIKKFVKQ